jgi:hypothetical protein
MTSRVAGTWHSVVAGLRFTGRLPAFLRRRISIDDACETLERRLRNREADFLGFLEQAVAANSASPYHQLLKHAGCEFGDIRSLVGKEGIEGALQQLHAAGVYLTVDEYKGRQPAVRGSAAFEVNPAALRNPLVDEQFSARTSGSRGVATPVPLNLAGIHDHAVNMALAMDARGGLAWRKAIWELSGIGPLLWYTTFGSPVERWFTKVGTMTGGASAAHHRKLSAVTWAGRLSGRPLPAPHHVTPDSPLPIAHWMARVLDKGEVPHLWTSTSSAVRLCQAATEAGVSLRGAQFTVTGEPVTEARLAVIRSTGAEAVPDYGSADSGGSVTCACLAPDAPDAVHVFSDLNAVIRVDRDPFPPGALLLTTLRPTAPFVFINVSMGDCATLDTRSCGCPVEKLGWTTRLRDIRSFEKLTLGGMSFLDSDVARILDEDLPRAFGGEPTDYQVAEVASGEGQPRLQLRVHPRVGAVDEAGLERAFLDALGSVSQADNMMVSRLRDESMLEVRREAPHMTATGKILHLWSGAGTGPGDNR